MWLSHGRCSQKLHLQTNEIFQKTKNGAIIFAPHLLHFRFIECLSPPPFPAEKEDHQKKICIHPIFNFSTFCNLRPLESWNGFPTYLHPKMRLNKYNFFFFQFDIYSTNPVHCLNPNPTCWTGNLNPCGSIWLENPCVNSFGFGPCWKNPEFSTRLDFTPLWTSSSIFCGTEESTWHAEGTKRSFPTPKFTIPCWTWPNSFRTAWPAAQSTKLPAPTRPCCCCWCCCWWASLLFSWWCRALRELTRGRAKQRSSISGRDSSTSSRWEEEELEEEPLLYWAVYWSLLETTPFGTFCCALEFFLYIRHRTQSSSCISRDLISHQQQTLQQSKNIVKCNSNG